MALNTVFIMINRAKPQMTEEEKISFHSIIFCKDEMLLYKILNYMMGVSNVVLQKVLRYLSHATLNGLLHTKCLTQKLFSHHWNHDMY